MLPAIKALERWLKNRPLLISLILALVVSYVTGADGIDSEEAMPLGDGEHNALRCMTLYGFRCVRFGWVSARKIIDSKSNGGKG
jgi:hypothetical protein